MKHILLLLLLCLNAFLTGCAYLHSMGPDVPQTIDELVADSEYGKALEILSYIETDRSNYSTLMEKKEEIKTLAAKLELQTITKAKQLQTDNKWYEAEQLFTTTLKKLPKNSILLLHQQTFLQERDNLLDELELHIDLNRARWLIANTHVEQEIIRILPNAEKQYPELKDFRIQKEKTAQHLLQFTHKALKQRDRKQAKIMLGLIDKLEVVTIDQKQVDRATYQLNALQEQQQVRDDKERAKTQQRQLEANRRYKAKQEKNTQTLIDLLSQNPNLKNLAQAKKQLDSIRINTKKYGLSHRLQEELNHHYQQGIKRHIRHGRELYSQGKIAAALEIWQPLSTIAPKNQKLNEYIERAQHVLIKLQRLQQEQPAR